MKKKKKISGPIEKQQRKWGYIFIFPCIVGLVCFNLGPILFSFFLSFHEWNIVGSMKFIGLDNYQRAFLDPLTWQSLKITGLYAIMAVPVMTMTSFLIAILLNVKNKAMPVFRTIFYIPSILPMVVTCAVWMFLYNPQFGVFNQLMDLLGLPRSNFVYSADTVIQSLVFMAVWGSGNLVIIYLAGLQGVSAQLYEAAEIDGAGEVKKFWHVTIPMMTPIIFYNVVMSIINSMQIFTQPYIMTEGGPNNASMFISLLIYNHGFKFQSMGYAAALSWILFIIVAIVTVILFTTQGRWVFYESESGK